MILRTLAPLFLVSATTLGAQSPWEFVYPDTVPPHRLGGEVAFDSQREVVVLYGGGFDGETWDPAVWEWDGTDWELRPSPVIPAARRTCGMCYDSNRGRIVVFGGQVQNGNHVQQTFEWDGSTWSLEAVGGPSPRIFPGMAFDSVRNVTVLYSGSSQGDTWEWDGSTWTQRFPATVPPARSRMDVAFDAARGVVVMHGGSTGVVSYDDTWEWDGVDWVERFPAHRPPISDRVQMTYDSDRQVTVVHVEPDAGDTDLWFPTWEWDGVDWTQSATDSTFSDCMAYDSVRREIIAIHTYNSTSHTFRYSITPPASFELFGVGCLGSQGLPTLSAATGSLPYVGQSFTLVFDSLPTTATAFGILGQSDTLAATLPLPASLDPIGMTGCDLLVSLDVVEQFPTLNGFGYWVVNLPNDDAIAGLPFFVQGLVMDPAANPFGATVTNGGRGIVGGL